MTDEILKPCPFCGGKANLYKEYPFDGYQRESPTYTVTCSGICAKMCSWSREKVIEMWNRRVNNG